MLKSVQPPTCWQEAWEKVFQKNAQTSDFFVTVTWLLVSPVRLSKLDAPKSSCGVRVQAVQGFSGFRVWDQAFYDGGYTCEA